MRRLAILLIFCVLTASAQQPAAVTDAGVPTFITGAQLVIETVTVRDRNGNPIPGLTAKDFIVTEDGKPQTLAFVEFQTLPNAPATGPATYTQSAALLPGLTLTQIARERPGEVRYRDRRLLALYFDLSALPEADLFRAIDSADKFIRSQMTASDLLAVMAFDGGGVQVLQDFTDDRDRLLSTLLTLLQIASDNPGDLLVDSSEVGASFGQNSGEFNLFTTDRQLAALQTATQMLGTLSEKKALVYFASGLQLNGTNNQAQLRATINTAVRSGVSYWPVDARGLIAQAPMGDARRPSPGGLAMYTGASSMSLSNRLQRSQDTLYALAADTGGKALLDYNDLSRGITQAQQAISSYYILGYYTSNQPLDGKFRRVRITLREGVSGELDYRQGYYAGKEFSKFSTADRERQMEEALLLGDPITELTVALEVNYFQLNTAEYYVPIAVKIPGSELALAKRRGAEHTRIDFIGEVKDEYGSTVANLRDKVDIKLSDATAAELTNRPIQYDTGFTVLPGKYSLKFLARDLETGRIGTFLASFVVPNLNKDDGRLPISTVVLSSQRVPLDEALFNAAKDKGRADVSNPLVQEGQKLLPSITRVFSRAKDLYVYVQAYQQGVTAPNPMVGFVTFYRDGVKAFQTELLQVNDAVSNRLNTVPLKFSLSLDALDPGEYATQVTVLDPARQRAAFWQAPIMIVP